MAKTAADVLIDTIHDWGVKVVFGLPGGVRAGGVHLLNGLYDAKSEHDLQEAVDLLNRGEKIAIMAGRGALGAADEREQTAENWARLFSSRSWVKRQS